MELPEKLLNQKNFRDNIIQIKTKYNLNEINDKKILEVLIKSNGNIEKALVKLLK